MTTSWPPRFAAVRARLAISAGVCPATIGSTSTPIDLPSVASCSMAAGRRTSSEAISTRFLSVFVSRSAILAVVVVLPEPCRPAIMMTFGGSPSMRSGSGGRIAAEHFDQRVVNDLHDLLAGLHRFDDGFADRLGADLGDEILDHRQGDVGLQQRDPNLAQGRFDVRLAERTAPGELVEYAA